MSSGTEADFWTDETSVLLTSYWGWEPHHWGTVGWTGERGQTRRDNLLRKLTDPFITVIYITNSHSTLDLTLRKKIAGFYLTTHETGDRNQWVHPRLQGLEPNKWRHSVRAVRAFSYLPEYRLDIRDFDPTIASRALFVASMAEEIIDRKQIAQLRDTPWVEVDVYKGTLLNEQTPARRGGVRAGPVNENGYEVSPTAAALGRQLYVPRLEGGTDTFLGRPCPGRAIYKIGLSISPDLRRQSFQKSMPHGVYRWHLDRTTHTSGYANFDSFKAAIAGEDAMKWFLGSSAEWLGGEFYLATEAEIDKAWLLGHSAANAFGRKS